MLVLFILLLALIFGGFGLFVDALQWMLIIAAALVVVGFFTGYRTSDSGRRWRR